MKGKRRIFLCCLMTLLMAFVMAMPMSASADVGDTDVAKIGDTGYGTLEDAFSAAENGDIIKVIASTGTSTDIINFEGKSVTLDLNNQTVNLGSLTVGKMRN